MKKLFLNKLHNLILNKGKKEEGVAILLQFLSQLGYGELVEKFNCLKE